MKLRLTITLAILLTTLSFAAMAQTNEWGDPLPPQPQPSPSAEPAPDAGAGQPGAQTAPQPAPAQADPAADATAKDGPKGLHEEEGKGYHYVGVRWRWIFVPKWFITMFNVDLRSQNQKKPLISNFGIGAEYTYRKNNFDITAAIWGAQLDWEEPLYFKGGNEPEQSWTEVTSGLSALLFTADFIWSTPIRDWVAITYGVGLGFGIPIGDPITETEAYYDASTGMYAPCNGPGDPDAFYCEADGEYGDEYDKLKVIPWINFLVGARFKPHEHIALYVDGGFGLGFQMGLRGGYIF